MKFTKSDLDWATEQGIISPEQNAALTAAFDGRWQNRASLTLANLFYYLGGLTIIASMSLYVGLNWEDLGGVGHLTVSLVYGGGLLASGHLLWSRRGRRIPGGILVTAAVCMIPMLVYALHELTGWWVMGDPGDYREFHIWIRSGWAVMEFATAAGALIALRFYRFPFLTMPLAFVFWYFSMDLTAVLYGPSFSMQQRCWVSVFVGLAMLAAAFGVDRRTREDFAFWGYLFGMLAFWGGLSTLNSDSELSRFLYCLINVGLMLVSVLLQRRVFVVFGALGLMSYLGHLAWNTFKDDLAFPFILSAIGALILVLGVLYHKHQKRLEQWLLGILPQSLKAALPQFRG